MSDEEKGKEEVKVLNHEDKPKEEVLNHEGKPKEKVLNHEGKLKEEVLNRERMPKEEVLNLEENVEEKEEILSVGGQVFSRDEGLEQLSRPVAVLSTLNRRRPGGRAGAGARVRRKRRAAARAPPPHARQGAAREDELCRTPNGSAVPGTRALGASFLRPLPTGSCRVGPLAASQLARKEWAKALDLLCDDNVAMQKAMDGTDGMAVDSGAEQAQVCPLLFPALGVVP